MSKLKGEKIFRHPVAYKISAVYGGLFIFIGIFLPFWALWLSLIGLSPVEISILIGFPSIFKVFLSPYVGQLCDKWGQIRRPLLVILILSIVSFCFYFTTTSFFGLALVTLVFSLIYYSSMPLVESYAVRSCDQNNLNYGKIRSVGSIVFILISIAFGYYLDRFGYDDFLYYMLGALVITFFAVFMLPHDHIKLQDEQEDEGESRSPLKRLLTNKNFIAFLVVQSLIHMSHGFIYVMGSYHWQAQGIDKFMIGILWSVGIFTEILIFMVGGKIIAAYRPMHLLSIIAAFGALRWLVIGMTSSVPILIAVQTLHGLTYGATHLVAMYFLSSRVPRSLFTSAQSLYSSVPMGLALGGMMLFSGTLYDYFQGYAYFFMAFLCLIAIVVARNVRRVEL